MPRRFWLIFTLALVCVSSAAAADPIAFLVALRGKVEVTPALAKQPQRATLGRPLERGDRVIVGPASGASIFFSEGNVIELAENSSVSVGGRVAAKGKPELSAEVFSNVSKFITGGSRQTGLMALAPMRGAGDAPVPIIVAPRRTEITDDRPSFDWRLIEGATRYRVTLSGDQGELWNREATIDSLAYPADVPALAPDTDYLWQVQAFSDRGPLRDEDSYFRVLSPKEAEAVHDHIARIRSSAGGNGQAAHYLMGSYLFGRGLYRDACAEFEALCRLAPETAGAHEALGNAYRAVGLMDLAATEFQKALALGREQ